MDEGCLEWSLDFGEGVEGRMAQKKGVEERVFGFAKADFYL